MWQYVSSWLLTWYDLTHLSVPSGNVQRRVSGWCASHHQLWRLRRRKGQSCRLLLFLLGTARELCAIALEGLLVAELARGQGHDDVRVSRRLWLCVDGAQKTKTDPRQTRAPQQHVCRQVRLLSADQAARGAGHWAVSVAAASTGVRWPASDAVQIRLRSSPVTGAQLVDVHCGVAVVDWDGRRCLVAHDAFEEAGRLATPPLPDGRPPDRSDQRPEVGRDVLFEGGPRPPRPGHHHAHCPAGHSGRAPTVGGLGGYFPAEPAGLSTAGHPGASPALRDR